MYENFLIFLVLLLVACSQVSENNIAPPSAPEDSKTQKVDPEGGLELFPFVYLFATTQDLPGYIIQAAANLVKEENTGFS